MPKDIINPNWHVILIHFPLGVFMLGLTLEVIFLLLRHHSSARTAARWMIVIGALAGVPTAYAGAYALNDVVHRTAPAAPADAPWHVVTNASTLSATQWEMIRDHAWKAGSLAILAALIVTLAVACTDRWRDRLYPLFLLLLLGCAAYIGWGAWFGGEMVYREAVAVKLPTTIGTEPKKLDPLQVHVTLAGIVAAIGLLGIGLAVRAASTSPHWEDPELHRAGLTAMPNRQRGGAEDLAMLRSFAPQVEVTGIVERIPIARYWLLVFVISAVTSLAGWWVLGYWHGTYAPKELWKLVTAAGYVRRFAHVIGAATVITLPLVMALLARFARRSRGAAALFGMILVLALAAQAWLGVLLLVDQAKVGDGVKDWYRIQPAASATSVP